MTKRSIKRIALTVGVLFGLALWFVGERAIWNQTRFGLAPVSHKGLLKTDSFMAWDGQKVRWTADQNGDGFPDLVLLLIDQNRGITSLFREDSSIIQFVTLSGVDGGVLKSQRLESTEWDSLPSILPSGSLWSPWDIEYLMYEKSHLRVPKKRAGTWGQEPVLMNYDDSQVLLIGGLTQTEIASFPVTDWDRARSEARSLVLLPGTTSAPMPANTYAALTYPDEETQIQWALRIVSGGDPRMSRILPLRTPTEIDRFYPETIIGAFDRNGDGALDWLLRCDFWGDRLILWFDGESGEGTFVDDSSWKTIPFSRMHRLTFDSSLAADMGWLSVGMDKGSQEVCIVLRGWSTSTPIWKVNTGLTLPDRAVVQVGSDSLGDLDGDGVAELGITVSVMGVNENDDRGGGSFFCGVLSGATGAFLDENE